MDSGEHNRYSSRTDHNTQNKQLGGFSWWGTWVYIICDHFICFMYKISIQVTQWWCVKGNGRPMLISYLGHTNECLSLSLPREGLRKGLLCFLHILAGCFSHREGGGTRNHRLMFSWGCSVWGLGGGKDTQPVGNPCDQHF